MGSELWTVVFLVQGCRTAAGVRLLVVANFFSKMRRQPLQETVKAMAVERKEKEEEVQWTRNFMFYCIALRIQAIIVSFGVPSLQ